MPATIDLAISIGMFIIFVALVIANAMSYFANYRSQAAISEYRSAAHSLYILLFSNRGVPANWEDLNVTPVLPGLMTDLYRLAFSVNNNATARPPNTNFSVNVTFDPACANKAWNNTVVLYDSGNHTLVFGVQNAYFCSSQYLQSATIVFNDTFSSGQTKYYFLYYSPDRNITAAASAFPSAYAANMTTMVYPEEKLKAVSIAKLSALRSLDYNTLLSSLGDYSVYMQVGR